MAGRELTRRGRGQELVPGGLGSWGPFEQLRREMDRLFESFPRLGLGAAGELSTTAIPVDIEESDGHVRVQAELPGVTEKDIELSLDPTDELLVIKGEKKVEHEKEEGGVYRSERAYGRFERTVQLPAPVKEDEIEAHFKNGVLTIDMTKAEEGKQRKKIPIKAS